jgi:PKD repeat protein
MQTLNNKVATRKLRVLLDTPVSGGTLGLQAIEVRAAPSSANLAIVPANTRCSAVGSTPGNAADNNAATVFTANTTRAWWEVDLGALHNVTSVTLVARNDTSHVQAPQNTAVAFQDEHGRWVRMQVQAGMTWAQGASVTIPIQIDWGSLRLFRLRSIAYMSRLAGTPTEQPTPTPTLVVEFSVDVVNGTAPLTVQTTNTSQGATSYVWDWGDGSPTSSSTSPSHTYTTPGTRTITLTATGPGGTDSATTDITIVAPSTSLPVLFSASAAKTSPQSLASAALSGQVYVFIADNAALTKVEFWLDSASPAAPTEAVYRTENAAPWDLMGSLTVSPFGPAPFDTTALNNGSHTISVRITFNGVVQPIYYVQWSAANTVPVTTMWPSGSENIGTAKNSSFFTPFDTFRGRPTDFTTVNGIGFSLQDYAYAVAPTTNPPTPGVRGWNYYGTSYWPALSWYTGVMLIQVNPCGMVAGMFDRDKKYIILPSTQSAYDALMAAASNGAADAAWYQIGASYAACGRTWANTILLIAHEFNGTWYPWCPVNTTPAVWIGMWRRIVAAFRNGYKSILPNGNPPRIGWCYTTNPDPAKGGNYACSNVWDYYPGDAHVDTIVLDEYDGRNWNNNNFSSWTSFQPWHNSSYAAITYCVAHKNSGGPGIAWGEWNIQNANAVPPPGAQWPDPQQDNPVYIQRMWDMFSYCRDQGIMHGECLFSERGAAGQKILYPQITSTAAKNVNASNLWRTLWGGA